MAKPVTVQIPQELFLDICRYFLLDSPLDPEEIEGIQSGLQDKLDAMARREAYSQYKNTSLTEQERQAARKRYLDMVGMREGYRWASLEPPQ